MPHPLKRIYLLLGIVACPLVFSVCGIEQPGVDEKTGGRPLFVHDSFKDLCAQCHEVHRPAPVNDVEHGRGKDCVACHKPSDTKAGWLPPEIFTHSPTPTTCLTCHVKDRPEPPHVETGDCVSCHQFPQWKPQ